LVPPEIALKKLTQQQLEAHLWGAANPGRAKNGHAWTDEMKSAKSAQEIAHHFQQRDEFFEARARSFEEDFIRALR
jgi:hypothetical protein